MKGVPFAGDRYHKRAGIFRNIKGCHSFYRLFITIFRTDKPYGCITKFIRHYMKMTRIYSFLVIYSLHV